MPIEVPKGLKTTKVVMDTSENPFMKELLKDTQCYHQYERTFPFATNEALFPGNWKYMGKFTRKELEEKHGTNFINRRFGNRMKFEECK